MQQHGINGEIYGECSERWEEEKGQEERLIKEESRRRAATTPVLRSKY